jgi:hypothetical protein
VIETCERRVNKSRHDEPSKDTGGSEADEEEEEENTLNAEHELQLANANEMSRVSEHRSAYADKLREQASALDSLLTERDKLNTIHRQYEEALQASAQ